MKAAAMELSVTDKAGMFREKARTCTSTSDDIKKFDIFIAEMPFTDNNYLSFIAQCPVFIVTWKRRSR
ncbi:hypothetical protein H4R19_004039 [Coemansia spiralis]|nr:hypothetical protein H4R19_004039 [Coemansia spiralis]